MPPVEVVALLWGGLSVVMAAATPVRTGCRRFTGVSCVTLRRAAAAAMPAMAAMSTVAKDVHRDEQHADQYPEPVCDEPLHDGRPSSVSSYGDVKPVGSVYFFSAPFWGVPALSIFPMS